VCVIRPAPARRRCLCGARVRGDQKATVVSRRALGFVGTGAQEMAKPLPLPLPGLVWSLVSSGRACVPRAPIWSGARSVRGAAGSGPVHASAGRPALSRLTDDHRRTCGYGVCSPTVRRWWRCAYPVCGGQSIGPKQRTYGTASCVLHVSKKAKRKTYTSTNKGTAAVLFYWQPGTIRSLDHPLALASSRNSTNPGSPIMPGVQREAGRFGTPLGCTHAINSARGWVQARAA